LQESPNSIFKKFTIILHRILRNLHQLKFSKMTFAITFIVRAYLVYKDIWGAKIGSELLCFPEPNNRDDCYAVADGTNIEYHVPRKIS